MNASNIELAISIVGGVTGIIGLLISLLGIRRNQIIAVHEFLSKMESEEFITARKRVYNTADDADCDVENEDISKIVNIFHHWGLLAKKHYLPMWVFDGASGNGACRLYEKTEKYIQKRRNIHNDIQYAEYFEWLYKKLKRKKFK